MKPDAITCGTILNGLCKIGRLIWLLGCLGR